MRVCTWTLIQPRHLYLLAPVFMPVTLRAYLTWTMPLPNYLADIPRTPVSNKGLVYLSLALLPCQILNAFPFFSLPRPVPGVCGRGVWCEANPG